MSDKLGYDNFCAACKGSREENGELICRDKEGKFYGRPVGCVCLTPCMKPENNKDEINKKLKGIKNHENTKRDSG